MTTLAARLTKVGPTRQTSNALALRNELTVFMLTLAKTRLLRSRHAMSRACDGRRDSRRDSPYFELLEEGFLKAVPLTTLG